MKTELIILFFLINLCGFSQTEILKSNISSGSDNVEVSNLKLIYTIGENVIQENETGTLQLSEGFLNPILIGVVLGADDFLELTGISIYPNPTVDFINLNFNKISNYDITMFDTLGKQLASYKTNTLNFKIDMNSFANGVYFINIKDVDNKQFKVFRILKN